LWASLRLLLVTSLLPPIAAGSVVATTTLATIFTTGVTVRGLFATTSRVVLWVVLGSIVKLPSYHVSIGPVCDQFG